MSVRRAGPGDVPAMALLLGELGYPVEPAALARRIERLPESTTVFVADAGEVVGLAALDVRPGLQSDSDSRRAARSTAALPSGSRRTGPPAGRLVSGKRQPRAAQQRQEPALEPR